MDRFWDVFGTSLIVSGLIALMLVGSVCYLSVNQQAIPDTLANATMVVVGFFFGKGSEASLVRVRKQTKGGITSG